MTEKLRPVAVPLVTVDPYFSIWSMSDCLYDDFTRHWTTKRHGLTGMIQIDGVVWKFLGRTNPECNTCLHLNEPAGMTQKSLKVDALSSKYIFEAGGICLEVDFTTPLLMDDLEMMSRPVTYVSYNVYSTDGGTHKVKLYFDIASELCVNTDEQEVVWGRRNAEGAAGMLYMGTREQNILGCTGDDTRIDWGYAYLVVPESNKSTTAISSYKVRNSFIESGVIEDTDDGNMPRMVKDNMPVMAVVTDLGVVGQESLSCFILLAYDDICSIEYFGDSLKAYWCRNGQSFEDMIRKSVNEYSDIMKKCGIFNEKLFTEAKDAGGGKYADLLALSYRQAIAAHKLVADADGNALFFSKECFSNGCIGTVDVSYPSIPLFLLYNTELVKGMMRPIFKYTASGAWPFEFAPHDVGQYPRANGQVYGLENGELKVEYQMPIEECGNMLIMAAAVCLADGNVNFAEENWKALTDWANYLVENGVDPGEQLCTDDFAGWMAHNVNLSVKAIMAIGGYSILCRMKGDMKTAEEYLNKALKMAGEWQKTAWDGDHYRLAFDRPGTWSLKYNMVWDTILGLDLFPETVKEAEVAYYISRQNRYGVPLDSRKAYTKADWLVWSAALAKSEEDFEKIIQPLWDFVNESPCRVPFSDWYGTTDRLQQTFQNRSVLGGIFIKMLKDRGF